MASVFALNYVIFSLCKIFMFAAIVIVSKRMHMAIHKIQMADVSVNIPLTEKEDFNQMDIRLWLFLPSES